MLISYNFPIMELFILAHFSAVWNITLSNFFKERYVNSMLPKSLTSKNMPRSLITE